MATQTKKTSTKKAITEDDVIALYMNHVLEHESHPVSVFKFCKEQKIKEVDFYGLFGSFASLRSKIWKRFYEVTQQLAEKDPNYEALSNRDKMLTFFYTFFEMLTANRSYVLFALGSHSNMLNKLEQLRELRSSFKNFAKDLIKDSNDLKQLPITKHPVGVFSEGAWVQLLFLMKFWMNDWSRGFEKTDVAIEKSVNTIFDVFDRMPLSSIIDLGKFLWKERML